MRPRNGFILLCILWWIQNASSAAAFSFYSTEEVINKCKSTVSAAFWISPAIPGISRSECVLNMERLRNEAMLRCAIESTDPNSGLHTLKNESEAVLVIENTLINTMITTPFSSIVKISSTFPSKEKNNTSESRWTSPYFEAKLIVMELNSGT